MEKKPCISNKTSQLNSTFYLVVQRVFFETHLNTAVD